MTKFVIKVVWKIVVLSPDDLRCARTIFIAIKYCRLTQRGISCGC